MFGVVYLFIFLFWTCLLAWMVARITRRLPERWWRTLFRFFLYIALYPMPLIDEILGAQEFKQLCDQYAVVQVDEEKAKGRTVYQSEDVYVEIKNTWVPVHMHQNRYVDTFTGELLLADTSLYANGGRLNPGSAAGREPWFFDHSCHVPTSRSKQSTVAKLGMEIGKSPSYTPPYKYAFLNKSELSQYLNIFNVQPHKEK